MRMNLMYKSERQRGDGGGRQKGANARIKFKEKKIVSFCRQNVRRNNA